MRSSFTRSTVPASPVRGSFLPRLESDRSFLLIDDTIPEDEFYACENVPKVVDDGEVRELYLYLIRHGEAEHNIKEKTAMAEALRSSLLEGLEDDHPETQRRMECARKSALNDTTLKDAHLSDQGRREAEQARDDLRNTIADNDLPQPNYIFVSPLTRTLETCDIIFPGHGDIHVRDALAERRTGKPPDTRSSASSLIRRPQFRHFSMEHLRVQSIEKKLEEAQKESIEQGGHREIVLVGEHDTWEKFRQQNYELYEEDKQELRKRTEQLFTMLTETSSESIACVTHKGYLRELERGPFGQPEAATFKNCEIRVYRLRMSRASGTLMTAERVI